MYCKKIRDIEAKSQLLVQNFHKICPFRKKKLSNEYIEKIIQLAEDKLTWDMGSRKIACIINEELKNNHVVDKKGKIVQIEKTTVNRILKKALGKPRKIWKVFFLTNKQKKKRIKFCKLILDKKVKPEQIFFQWWN